MANFKTLSAKNRGSASEKHQGEGTRNPPKITINSTTTIIPAIINGISKRKIARTTIAMSAIINKAMILGKEVSQRPWKYLSGKS